LMLQRTLREKCPLVVAVHAPTGGIGKIVVNRIAVGDMLGKDQPVILRLVGRTRKTLEGLCMETSDSAHGRVVKVEPHTDLIDGFRGAHYAILTAGASRSPGRPERKHLVQDNAAIYADVGKALNAVVSPDMRVTVVGNPANTNAWVVSQNAPKMPPKNIMAMVRLDENRAKTKLAIKAGVEVSGIEQVAVWGNHSSSMYPDYRHATATANGQLLRDLIADPAWERAVFVPEVSQRGNAIFDACGITSTTAAANASIDHGYTWHHGSGGKWTAMAVQSQGEYGITPGVWFTYPVIVGTDGTHQVVQGLDVSDPYIQGRLRASEKELIAEQGMVRQVLQAKPAT
jgi:malate dehydrogenase